VLDKVLDEVCIAAKWPLSRSEVCEEA